MSDRPGLGFRVLQLAVFGMGGLLIVGVIALFVAIGMRTGPPKEARQAVSTLPFVPFKIDDLPVPAGAEIRHLALDSGVLALHVVRADGQAVILLYRLADRKIVGELAVQPQ